MRNLCTSLLALGLVLALIQAPGPSEALKIKKVVKDAAKLSKKYGYLLASRKKKLYAIPFPMPLPVFVKRQHIYTQVPIIPRYVQHPQAYGVPAYATGESSSSYEPMASMQTSATASTSASYYGDSSSGSSQRQRSKKSAGQKETSPYSSSGSSSSSSSSSASAPDLSPTSPTATVAKYLTQLAGILGQSVPIFGGSGGSSNRDLLTKLLNGQAKVLPPTSLISAIKGPSAALLKYQQQQADSGQQDSTDQDSKQNESSSSGSSGADAQGYTGGATDSTKPPSESQPASQPPESTRPSASELHRSRYRVPYGAMRSPHGMMMDPRRIPMSAAMMGSPLMSPLAAMASMQAPGLMPRLPMSQLAAANQYLAMLDPQAAGQLDQLDSQSSEPNELTAGAALSQQSQPGQQTPDEPLSGGSGALDQQSQLLERRRQLLKLALIKERQEAERLLESRLVLARAKQINQQLNQLPAGQQQAMRLMSLYRQQQAAQQLQQMRYLQLLQQQQLQQNSIDNQ